MNLAKVKQDIQTRNASPVYIFTGEEFAVMDIYIQQMGKFWNKSIVHSDSFKQVFPLVSEQSILNKNGSIYIIRDDKTVLQEEQVWNIVENASWKDTVIFVFTSIDKRTAFYKRFKESVCIFEPLPNEILVKYIQKEIPLSNSKCMLLIEVCEHSYSRILTELDKIKQYTAGMGYTIDNQVYNHVLQELLDNGVIYKPVQDSIFLWSDAVMNRDVNKAFQYMEDCFASGEPILTMVTVLYNNMKQTLQVQSYDGNNITKSTGLTGWQVQCVKKFVGIYTIGELLDAMDLIRSMEMGIKLGTVEDSFVIPYIMTSVM